MKSEGISKDLFIISIITTIAVTFWLVLDLYRNFQKSEVTQVVKKQTETLNPKLDTSVLDELEKKQSYELIQESFPTVSQENPLTGTESGTL